MPKYINDGRWHSNDDITVFRLTNIEELLEQIRYLLLAERKQPHRRGLIRRAIAAWNRRAGDKEGVK
jgi:hypothetical protein